MSGWPQKSLVWSVFKEALSRLKTLLFPSACDLINQDCVEKRSKLPEETAQPGPWHLGCAWSPQVQLDLAALPCPWIWCSWLAFCRFCLCVIKAAFVSEIKKDFGDTEEDSLPGLSALTGISSLTDQQPTLYSLEIPKSATVAQPHFYLPRAPSKPGVGQVEKGRAQSQGRQLTAQGEAGHPQPEPTHRTLHSRNRVNPSRSCSGGGKASSWKMSVFPLE